MRKILLLSTLSATLLLGGCVAVPYDSPYAYGGGYDNTYYAPYGGAYATGAPLYVAPSVSVGVGFSSFSHRGGGGGWGHGGRGGGWGHGGGRH